MMPEVVIVDAVRTAIGRRKGSLSNMHPVDLLVPVLQALVQRNGIEAGSVEDVVVGCVTMTGSKAETLGGKPYLQPGFQWKCRLFR